MAKSKSGGTRSYIRGKIGADVYSVGKDGKGKRQQVVRSLAEQVANPQTEAQMFGRMVMSTVMQAVSNMKPIIDHSFDGIPAGQPSISEFIRRNYALIAADAKAHPASGNAFGLNKYQEKGAKKGAYIISKGNVNPSSDIELAEAAPLVSVALSSSAHTVGDLKEALGFNGTEDYITIVGLCVSGDFEPRFGFRRYRIDPSVADTTNISTDNLSDIFIIESNVSGQSSFSTSTYKLSIGLSNTYTWVSVGFILSIKNTDGWHHSTCVLNNRAGNADYTNNVALPTYPQGSARFLNGGDI